MELSEAYVLGLSADLEAAVPQLEADLKRALQRAQAVDAELGSLLRRQDASKAALSDAGAQAIRSGAEVTEGNLRTATLHQEIAGLRRRSADVKVEMDRVGAGAIHRKLRRERAKFSVQIEDRETELEQLRVLIQRERVALQESEKQVTQERDRSRAITAELDKLQSQLPSPFLYVRLFESVAARGHCRFFLDGDMAAWVLEMRGAIDWAGTLHRELRAGKYRLDQNSELVGGRSAATAEAIYGAVALGNNKAARRLFDLATDPALFFHQIFNIFRVWCLGLYLENRTDELRALLRTHRFAEGLRGGYVQAFIGLLAGDGRQVSLGIKDIARYEWELWQDASQTRGMGVINLGAIAISRLAARAGLATVTASPTVPRALVAAKALSVQGGSR